MATKLILSVSIFLITLLSVLVTSNGFPLYRIQLSSNMKDVVRRDRARHARVFNSTPYWPLGGSFDLHLYYMKVMLGTPPAEFNVVYDSGSDDLWVSCDPCDGCPLFSQLGIELNWFNPSSSSTASPLQCKDKLCPQCSKSKQCSYSTPYHDGSEASGYYLRDTLSFEELLAGTGYINSSASIAFGCTTHRSGTLSKVGVDGIFGFGRGPRSILSQLSSVHRIPKAFSQCVRGEGGGSLAFGKAVDPSIFYTELVPDKSHYYVPLTKISVGGKVLRIRPSVFKKSSKGGGTIIDSGTSYAYLVDEAYDPLVAGINAAVSGVVATLENTPDWKICYVAYDNSTSMFSAFPRVSLDFKGKIMKLGPEHYLVHDGYYGGLARWCLGILPAGKSKLSILGDLVLRNRVLVFDLDNNLIGWNDYYDCSLPMHVIVQDFSSSRLRIQGMLPIVLPICATALI